MTLPPSGLRKGQRALDTGVHPLLPLSIPFIPPLHALPPLKAHNFCDSMVNPARLRPHSLAVFLWTCHGGSTGSQSRL